MEKERTVITEWDIPINVGIEEKKEVLRIHEGECIYIVGRNGSGKSALLQRLANEEKEKGNDVVWITAHRQTWVESSSMDMTAQGREQSEVNRLHHERETQSRWRDYTSGTGYKVALFDMVAEENTLNARIANLVREKKTAEAEELGDTEEGPFRKINRILHSAKLGVRVENQNDRVITATNEEGQEYKFGEMSDGERNALLLAARVMTAKAGKLIILDEPERHLHASIIVPYIRDLTETRRDCAYVIATHELELPINNPGDSIVVLDRCHWSSGKAQRWEGVVLDGTEEIPEETKDAILGNRKILLFVEGGDKSRDRKIYQALYPEAKVVEKRGWREVRDAVRGMRGAIKNHHVEPVGIVDRDEMTGDSAEKLKREGIHALNVHSVEGLYYCREAIEAIAETQGRQVGEPGQTRSEDAIRQAIASLKEGNTMERMASESACRKVRREIMRQLPSPEQIRKKGWEPRFDLPSNQVDGEKEVLARVVEQGDWDEIVKNRAIRKSTALEKIARRVTGQKQTTYEQMVITKIQKDPEFAEAIRAKVGLELRRKE